MKNYNYLKSKIENVLLKRYAFNYLFSFDDKFILLLFSIINFILFSLFFVNEICNFEYFKTLFIYLTILFILLLIIKLIKHKQNYENILKIDTILRSYNSIFIITTTIILWLGIIELKEMFPLTFLIALIIILSTFYILSKISKYIPKFIWVGILGWILLTSSVVPDMLNYNTNMYIPGSTKGMDISKFLGINISYINFSKIININEFFLKSFKGIFYPENTSLVYTISLILLFVFLFLLFISTFSINKKFLGINKNHIVILLVILISISLLIISLITKIYFIPISLGLFGANIAIVFWEITDRGRNPEPFVRAVNFTIVTQLISANVGMIIYISIYPLFKYPDVLSTRDFITLLWIIIAGSGLSVFMALISQFIWSGKRLTEKYN